MAFFVVTRVHGLAWDEGRRVREQSGWDEHAAFMDALVDDGFVVLGGPLGDGQRALLVIEAEDEPAVHQRLAADPWTPTDVLRTGSVERWSVWLDGRAAVRSG